MLCDSATGKRWKPGESRESKLVLIGRDLDVEVLRKSFSACVAT
jgi:G3E family GTPase